MNNKQSNFMKAHFAKFMILIFLLLSLSLLTYVFYRAEIVHKGSQSHFYFNYYIFSIAAVFFWTTALFFKNEIKINLLLFSLSIILCFYFIEFILNFVILSDGNTFHRKIFNQKFDTRTTLEFVIDMRNKGKDIVPTYNLKNFIDKKGKKIYMLSPGSSNKITALCNEIGNYVTYKSDRYGFNNPDIEWDKSSTYLILIGDSHAHGHCIDSKKNIASQIRTITGKNVINLGMEGSGPLKELAILKEYATNKKPKNLVWLYYEGGEMYDLELELNEKILVNYLEQNFNQNLINQQKKIDRIVNEEINNMISGTNSLSYKTRFLRLYKLREFTRGYLAHIIAHKKNAELKNQVNPLLINILSEAKNLVESWGGKFFFVYLPEYNRYKGKVRDHDLYNSKAKIIKLVENINIPVVDLHQKIFLNSSNPLALYLCRKCHLSPYGYNEVAKFITTQITNN